MSKACPAGAYGARHPVIVGKRLDVSILRQFPINLVSSFFFVPTFFSWHMRHNNFFPLLPFSVSVDFPSARR